MDIPLRPILSTLRHHRLTALLLVLQVAFTCAIACNVAFMLAGRMARLSLPSGVAEDELSVVYSADARKDMTPSIRHAADLDRLRTIPGVRSVAAVSFSLPLNRNSSTSGVCPDQAALDRAMQRGSLDGTGCAAPSIYDGTPGLVATLGLRLVEGRDFAPGDYTTGSPAVAIVTRALAKRLYPDKDALGRALYGGDKPMRVVGVVDTLLRPALGQPGDEGDSLLVPQLPDDAGITYVLRSAPRERAGVLKAAVAALLAADPERIVPAGQVRTYAQVRAEYFQRDVTMVGLLVASALGLLFVTALGIAGLANFWVQQRRRTIGIRRAIGATRGDILRYFQAENGLIVGTGAVLGMALALALNLLLMRRYELPRLPLSYLPVGALALWALGQLSVLAPALRAASVPPVAATRPA